MLGILVEIEIRIKFQISCTVNKVYYFFVVIRHVQDVSGVSKFIHFLIINLYPVIHNLNLLYFEGIK